MSTPTPLPRALIVHAHPEPLSFNTAQMAAAAQSLRDNGYRVDVLDLYAEGWGPVLAPAEFPHAEGYFKPAAQQARAVADGTIDPTVRAHLDLLMEADLLVLSFPIWWFSLPAILKGWVDRVFIMGTVFGGEFGIFDEAAMVGKKALLLLSTGGSPESFSAGGAYGAMDDFLHHIRRGMLEFVGYEVLEPVITYGPTNMTDEGRADALNAVEQSFALIAADSQAALR